MVEHLYPQNLKGFNLKFHEAVTVLVFGLEDELAVQGKDVLFELGESKQLEAAVDCMLSRMYEGYSYALRRVLGESDSALDERMCKHYSLGELFQSAVKSLKNGDSRRNYRYSLIEALWPRKRFWQATPSDTMSVTTTVGDMTSLYGQVQQLMAEVRMYDEKRNQALERIEQLLRELKQREPAESETARTESSDWDIGRSIDLNGSILQLRLPYRSTRLLKELNLNTVAKAVEYFRDFTRFVKTNDQITMLEWLVMQRILRRYGLLPTDSERAIDLSVEFEAQNLSARTVNCLRRGFHDRDYTEWRCATRLDELVRWFADGASDGWAVIKGLNGFGKASHRELVEMLGSMQVELADEICFPSDSSPVEALDFDYISGERLKLYGIHTIGNLLAACQDSNRFTGLRYVDDSLYRTSVWRLQAYGFLA